MIDRELICKELRDRMGDSLLQLLGEAAKNKGLEVYVVGGFVRDLILGRASKDIDLVTEGSGIELAREVKRLLGRRAYLAVFKSFGTAQVKHKGLELEFVGARRESYRSDSRNPIVEDGTFDDDRKRRDFTINAMSICVNEDRVGEFVDPFEGMKDLHDRIIRTPLDPDTTFSDDPLRMMRAIRFATQLDFRIPKYILDSISANAKRIEIVSRERIADEFFKIMGAPKPSIGLALMERVGLMNILFPEIVALKGAETRDGIGHKDNFSHTLMVVDNIARTTDKLYLRLAALFHDIAKPQTKKFEKGIGWTFYNHNFIGAKMIPRIFSRSKFPTNEKMKYVQKLVNLHMRPATLADDGVSDSAIRRLLFEAGEDIDDLMLLCEADITSKNPKKVAKYLDNFAVVRQKLVEIEEKDRLRNFQPPVTGDEIMETFHLLPCATVGLIKEAIREAILDGIIPNEHEPALQFMYEYVKSNPSVFDKARRAIEE